MLFKHANLPASAGVYIFKHRGVPLYIGKAKNLKKRLVSYWRKNAGSKVKSLLQEADNLEIIETQSEIEAFIKEAGLIKQNLPRYNVLLRDDKNYFYVAITKEQFPRVFITHQIYKLQAITYKLKFVVPFTSGSALKITLKLLRKIFPYCTCKTSHKRPCLNAQIGRCLGFCCALSVHHPKSLHSHSERSEESHEMFRSAQHDKEINQYEENIKNITEVLTGKKKSLLKSLKKEIKKLSKEHKFEEAAKIRNQILGIENVFKHRFVLDSAPFVIARVHDWSKIEKELQTIFNSSRKISRVEGYDISNLSGCDATGSMVVFTDGLPDKKEYRQFRIKTVKQISDVDMLKEVIKRRVGHGEWSSPNLILIDGGKPQLSAVLSVIEYNKNISNTLLAALAKREEELYLPNIKKPIRIDTLGQATASFLKRVRDEAHRFARRYHHKLRERYLFY